MLKKILLVIFLLLLLIGVAISLIPLNSYKPLLAKQVLERTGMVLVIGGDVKLRIFPSVHFSLGDVQISPPVSGKDKIFAADLVSLEVELMPLFSKQIEVKGVDFINPKLAISRAASYLAKEHAAKLPDMLALKASEISVRRSGVAYALVLKEADLSYGKNLVKQLNFSGDYNATGEGKIGAKTSFVYDGKSINLNLAALNLSMFLGDSKQSSRVSLSGKYDKHSFKLDTLLSNPNAGNYKLDELKLVTGPWEVAGRCTINSATSNYNCAINQQLGDKLFAELLAGQALKLSGDLQHKANLQTGGNNLLAALQGDGSVNGKVTISGVHAIIPVAAQNFVQGIPDSVPMDRCDIKYHIARQNLYFDQANCQGPVIGLQLSGEIETLTQALHLQLMIDGEKIPSLRQKLAEPKLYFKISGTAAVPVISMDMRRTISPNLVNDKAIKKVLDQALPKELDSLKPLLQKGLKGLFK